MRQAEQRIPIVVLAGGESTSGSLPPGVPGERLTCAKSVAVRFDSHSVIRRLLSRLRTWGGFSPIIVCGPATTLRGEIGDAILVDTDDDLVTNAVRGLEIACTYAPDGRVAVTCADYLPTVIDLRKVERNLAATPQTSAFWYALIRPPSQSAPWDEVHLRKRCYPVRSRGDESIRAYPGHLLVLRWRLIERRLAKGGIEALYRARERPTAVRGLLTTINCLPTLLWCGWERRSAGYVVRVVRHAAALGRGLANRGIELTELTWRLNEIFVRSESRNDRGRIVLLDAWSLACDIDTDGEARAIAYRDGVASYSVGGKGGELEAPVLSEDALPAYGSTAESVA